MGTFETAMSAYYEEEEEEEDGYYEFEPLPALLEDEENISLADILSLRDSCLSEPEVWAVCLECVLALQSIAHSPLFHTLCITPDTLAFNAHGNVSFMEQLSDDPEGSFMPPEFDRTGNTFEGHVYSLGSTLAAALDFVIEPELEPELGPEIRCLLDQMQQERPSDRPDIQDIVSLGLEKLQNVSSMTICRKLSAIGRRVLSIESIGTFYDGLEGSWAVQRQPLKARWISSSEHNQANGLSEDMSTPRHHVGEDSGSIQNVTHARDVSPVREGTCSCGKEDLPELPLDSRSQDSSPVRRALGRSGRPRGVLNRSSSVPDSNNPPPPLPVHVNRNAPHTNLTEIGSEENVVGTIIRNAGLQNGNHNLTTQYHDSDMGMCSERGGNSETLELLQSSLDQNRNFTEKSDYCELGPKVSGQDGFQNYEDFYSSTSDETKANVCLYSPGNHMTKSMLCLNEETQDEWISLRQLLSRYCRPLSVNELWALCYTCLSTLQTYIDFPAYLCLDSVYVGCEGEVLFLKPKNTGSCDPFFLAPEFQEHGIVTEKACIYGVAAILWATAKFSLLPNQKLGMPRKLKRLLLEMAKRIPMERPSIAMAKKSCQDYLTRQGTSAEAVWTKLIHKAHQECNAESLNSLDNTKIENQEKSSRNKIGFVPCAGESSLSPVQGPVPHHYSVSADIHLPDAFTSPATHFTPIILAQGGATGDDSVAQHPMAEGSLHEYERSGGDHPEVLLNMDISPAAGMELGENEHHHLSAREPTSSHECSSTSSSGRTLVNSPSPSPPTLECTEPNTSIPPLCGPSSSCPSSSQNTGSFGSFLLRHDPRTGLLTLFPVQISVPELIPGLDLGLPPFSTPLQGQHCWAAGQNESTQSAGLYTHPGGHVALKIPKMTQNPPGPSQQSLTHLPKDPPRKSANIEGDLSGMEGGATEVSSELPPAHHPLCHPSLRGVIGLIREEFAFQGYLENGVEDRAMGEYILSLRDLQYDTFRSAVSEKYCDLYWDEKLLDSLYHMVNRTETSLSPRDSSHIQSSNTPLPSKSQQRPSRLPPDRGSRESGDAWPLNRDGQQSGPLKSKGGGEDVSDLLDCKETACKCKPKTAAEEPQNHGLPDIDTALALLQRKERKLEVWPGGKWILVNVLLEQEEGRSLGAEGLRCIQGWALSFYGEEYFKEDVLRYAKRLGQHNESSCLEAKMQEKSFLEQDFNQELHQQLMIETRNLKKTRIFYHKLLHQERKTKGSDAKLMLSKIKVQLEEMKSKVDFLDSVRKYLEVLFMEQWGLDMPLIPSLAVSGPAPLELRPSVDSSVLTFQPRTERGKGSLAGTSSLQAGTPLGLMSYLYARDAPLEGYIQQFLYTFRYFCTPEDFLQFLKDKFISAAGRQPSAERLKVHNRTLDLLQVWLEDCRQVDFLPKSSLQQSLQEFLTLQVIPVESRGEALLTLLHNPPRKRRSQTGYGRHGSPIRNLEEDDVQSVHSLCRKSSIEDSGRKSFQWRISRVVEPQSAQPKEKAYSIAAALPRPCYSTLLDELSSSCLRSEDRYPFYQSEHNAQHIANQLTLIQQEIFQGCHPVHFLNSRAQGVRDKAVSKTPSPDLPPAEGSNLFASDVIPQERYLPQLLKHADRVATWVSAEIVICDSLKAQASLLTKFLLMAKRCYGSRNFATAIQILLGLENVIIKQLPAWRHLSTKVCEILEELRTVQVFLKSDNLCLMEGESFRRLPTLPGCPYSGHAHTAAGDWSIYFSQWGLQVAQTEEHSKVQAYLRHRITLLSETDIALLAAENDANFHQISAERHSKRIQDTLRRVKATFQ
ncbi:hypothetical protein AGOR_G00117170 [Albula goreensis]|uniref:Uncharacterized protein n=1 Tax=Albula goreensis TaxID=1534307 RepID=A0A8T3DBC1_9TELE|nr:hypothetical protein AGOR_G00117170 [Albula goreensis]